MPRWFPYRQRLGIVVVEEGQHFALKADLQFAGAPADPEAAVLGVGQHRRRPHRVHRPARHRPAHV